MSVFSTDKNSCGFVVYQNHKLFQSKTFTATSDFSQKIISGKINTSDQNPDVSVQMVFNPTVSLPMNRNLKHLVPLNYKTRDNLNKRTLQSHAGFLVVGPDSVSFQEPG